MNTKDNQKDFITVTWHIDDVLEVAPELTKEQARQVLQNVKKNHDANYGISYDTLEAEADYILKSINS